MNINAIGPVAPKTANEKHPLDERLRETCAEFESLFINHMLKTMDTPMAEDGILGESNAGYIIKSMFNENMAQGIARGGGIGIGKVLYESLMNRQALK